jgi:hypothetical protein
VKATTRGESYAGLSCRIDVAFYAVSSWRLGDLVLAPESLGSNRIPLGLDGMFGAGTLQRLSPIVVDYADGELLVGADHGAPPRLIP